MSSEIAAIVFSCCGNSKIKAR